jgi:cytidylate kinase
MGVGGDAVARQVSEILGMPLFDQEILTHIARTARVRLETVKTLDEQAQGRVEEYISSLLRERRLDHTDFLVLLARTVVSLWEHGPCVLMGHGAVRLVPREHAFKARLVADIELRVRVFSEERGLSRHDAERQLRRLDSEQKAFHRRFFDVDVDDPHHYDLSIDCGRLGPTVAARLIAQGYRERFPARRR